MAKKTRKERSEANKAKHRETQAKRREAAVKGWAHHRHISVAKERRIEAGHDISTKHHKRRPPPVTWSQVAAKATAKRKSKRHPRSWMK